MVKYNAPLNEDQYNIKTSAEHDGSKWINRVKAQEIEAALSLLLTKTGFDAKADITMSALRDAIKGASNKTLTDLATTLATLSNKDFATQTTLAAILSKIIAAPATEAKQDSLETVLKAIRDSVGIKKIVDPLPAGTNKIGKVEVDSSALPTGAATAAKQDSIITELQAIKGKDFATQTTQSAILSKLSADPATQTTLASILAKMIAAPATEAKQTALNALIGEVQASPTANTLLARLKNLETKVDAIIADGIQLSGSKMELYGKAISDRPAANTVPAGATFTIVDRDLDKNWISDGTNWEEV